MRRYEEEGGVAAAVRAEKICDGKQRSKFGIGVRSCRFRCGAGGVELAFDSKDPCCTFQCDSGGYHRNQNSKVEIG